MKWSQRAHLVTACAGFGQVDLAHRLQQYAPARKQLHEPVMIKIRCSLCLGTSAPIAPTASVVRTRAAEGFGGAGGSGD